MSKSHILVCYQKQELFSLMILVLLLISLNLIIILGPQRLVDFTDFFPMGDSVELIPYILFKKYQTINLNDAIFKAKRIIKQLSLKAILVYYFVEVGTLNQF